MVGSNYPESPQAGGYPVPTDPKLDPINETFPIFMKEWRGSAQVTDNTTTFLAHDAIPFPTTHLRRVAEAGGDLIREHWDLRRAIRSAQARKMQEQSHLATQAQIHLCSAPELREDICELHRMVFL